MRVNILVGGPLELVPLNIIEQRCQEIWIGVDRGAITLLKNNIKPAVAIGDFDSIPTTDLDILDTKLDQVTVYPPEKDYTDTQLGVKAAITKYSPDKITIFGATGGRIDHFLANLFLPLQAEFRPFLSAIEFIDTQNTVRYYLPGNYEITRETGKRYLAFANLTPVKSLFLPDEKYPLDDWNSEIPFCWTSNEFTAERNHFSFTDGIIAVIQCADRL